MPTAVASRKLGPNVAAGQVIALIGAVITELGAADQFIFGEIVLLFREVVGPGAFQKGTYAEFGACDGPAGPEVFFISRIVFAKGIGIRCSDTRRSMAVTKKIIGP